MNDNGKKILFNKSSIFNLKAELIKKQEEVNEKKRWPQNKISNFKPPKQQQEKNNITKKTFKDNLKEVDTEELEACRKSKAALEKKAELYEHLSDRAGSSQLAGQYLVDFNSKKQQLPLEPLSVPNIDGFPDDEDDDNDNEWTEFVDCLGRSRKCLKTDLDAFKRRDLELILAFGKENDLDLNISNNPDEQQVRNPEKEEVVQKTKDYLQSLRDKWEQKEAELLAKDGDIHYQDILFDEARIHGVGYYSFSTNEAERRKQMSDLMRTREDTLRAQKEADVQRKKREELIAARTAAARARMRLKAGLPPEKPQENKKDFETCLLEFLNQQRNEAEIKAKEEENKFKEELEKEREKIRQAYVREWDIGKEGFGEGKTEKFRQLTQEEYVEQQRAKRINEFAPPQSGKMEKSNRCFNENGSFVERNNVPKTWSDVRPGVSYSNNNNSANENMNNEGLRFSSKKNMKYKNFVQSSTLILNELDDDISDNKPKCPSKSKIAGHAEIPPPPSFEYYGPSAKYRKPNVPFDSDINEAYDQGVQQLEKKEGKANISDQYDFII